jgi:phosphatidate cytidylyltransferase
LAVIYVGVGFYYLIDIRTISLSLVFYALLLIWSTDIGAYFAGRFFGKRKLWPLISPKKTIEGSIGGTVFAVFIVVLFYVAFQGKYIATNVDFSIYLVASILLSIFGQIGDLVESAFKRSFDVKDSGGILPGHGGILDRFDSLLFVLPILHMLLS